MGFTKRPQVIRDLLELATYIADDNLDVSDRFLAAAEETFNQLAKMPEMGKIANSFILSWLMFDSKLLRDLKITLSSTA